MREWPLSPSWPRDFPSPYSSIRAEEHLPTKGVSLRLSAKSYFQGLSFPGLNQPSRELPCTDLNQGNHVNNVSVTPLKTF